MGLIIPKCNAEPETLDLTLKVYYDANDWVTNAELIECLSRSLINAGIETEKKEPQSYTKKTQVLSYYGLLEWEDPSNTQSRRKITDNGKKLYEYKTNNDIASLQCLLLEILRTNTFGRNVLGCDSDSDLEAPNIFLKSCMLIKDLTNKEFGYILGKMEFSKMDLVDALFDVVMKRNNGITVQPDSLSAKWSDPKPILALADWGIFEVTKIGNSKIYNVNRDVLLNHSDKLIALRTKNTESQRIVPKNSVNIVDSQKQLFGYRPYITAIKSKPFLLLAGISGTGKSRIVRELARACWDAGSEEYKAQKPRNFEMVQVKPNWHDSSELIGYVSRINGKPEYVVGDFLKFIAKAWENWLSQDQKPYFLCLDEMNLAPVEQYFAEYLSVVESRKVTEDGSVVSDPIVRKDTEGFDSLLQKIAWEKQELNDMFETNGICIPPNLIVVGTVNMDETTFSFSRKVLDRAMTIEMNEVDLHGGLTKRHEQIGKLGNAELVGNAVEGVDVYEAHKDVCDMVIEYLEAVNGKLEETPFKIAYRTRNEFLLYVVNNLPYNKDEEDNDLDQNYVIARALDEITSMKILSRIEGDETKVNELFGDDKDLENKNLKNIIKEALKSISDDYNVEEGTSVKKLDEMKKKLTSGYTSFWS